MALLAQDDVQLAASGDLLQQFQLSAPYQRRVVFQQPSPDFSQLG
jgi:hypothetical protein